MKKPIIVPIPIPIFIGGPGTAGVVGHPGTSVAVGGAAVGGVVAGGLGGSGVGGPPAAGGSLAIPPRAVEGGHPGGPSQGDLSLVLLGGTVTLSGLGIIARRRFRSHR